jgi:hypothetical protein
MGLDIYVMPLWRFKAGDFRTPLEAAGFRPKVITPDGEVERPSSVGWLGRWRARRVVAAVRKAVEAANGVRVRWRDDGGAVYGRQSGGMEALRAFARWLDLREEFPEFGPPPEGNYYQHPALTFEGDRPPSCPHLVGHDCHSGYFLPCEFERLAEAEPYLILGHWPASRSVGSSPRLARELALVGEHLRVPEGYDVPDDDPLAAVRAAYLQLTEVAGLSCRHGLPIIFWG